MKSLKTYQIEMSRDEGVSIVNIIVAPKASCRNYYAIGSPRKITQTPKGGFATALGP